MNIEIINTGAELLLGRRLNTHQEWLCRQCTDLGHEVLRQTTVSDDSNAIRDAVQEALSRVDFVITTGGLGPTSDDRTRECIAALFGRPLHEDAAVLAAIGEFFEVRKRTPPASVRVQALVPEGAVVLHNRNGTAPGLLIELNPNPFSAAGKRGWLVLLPGPPRELYPMFLEGVVPLLKELSTQGGFVSRTYKTTGLGEAFLEEKLAAPLRELVGEGLDLGYCAHLGDVDVRVAARGTGAEALVQRAAGIVEREIAAQIYGMEGETLESVVVRMLTDRQQTLALAESCTGGLIAHRITNVPGASAVLLAGLVTYSNESKERLLGVSRETLEKYGAVSEPVAREMAEGARERNRSDYAIAVTGIAGPTGGTDLKPVGTVFIAMATPDRTVVESRVNSYDREGFKAITSQQALDLLRRCCTVADQGEVKAI